MPNHSVVPKPTAHNARADQLADAMPGVEPREAPVGRWFGPDGIEYASEADYRDSWGLLDEACRKLVGSTGVNAPMPTTAGRRPTTSWPAGMIAAVDAITTAPINPDDAARVRSMLPDAELVDMLGLGRPAPRRILLEDGRVRYEGASGRPEYSNPRECRSCRRSALTPGLRPGDRCTWCKTRPQVVARLVMLADGYRVVCSCGWSRDVIGDRLAGSRVRSDHERAEHPGYFNARKAERQARAWVREHPDNPDPARRRADAAAARDDALVARVGDMRAQGVDWPQIATAVGHTLSYLRGVLRRVGALDLANASYLASRTRTGVAA